LPTRPELKDCLPRRPVGLNPDFSVSVYASDTWRGVCAPWESTPTERPHYAACKGVGPDALRGAGLARSRPLWSSGRSFARLKQVSASLSHRALASGRPHCSAIATHAARRRRYSSECMLSSRHANIHPKCITSMRYRQRNMPLDRVTSFFPFFLVLPGCRKSFGPANGSHPPAV
jgi:hypothetical protein